MGTRAVPAICHNFLYRLISDFMAGENFEYSFFHIANVAPLDSLIEIIKKLRAEFKTFNILINEEKSVLTPQKKLVFVVFASILWQTELRYRKKHGRPSPNWVGLTLQTQLTVKSFGVTEFSIKLIQFALFPYLGAE